MIELDRTLLAAPFCAGLLVLATHVPLGIEVLRRGIIFIDLAIAQMAALGVLAAQSLFGAEAGGHGLVGQLAAAAAAVTGALLLTWTEKRWPDIQEALIGLLFVLSASAGILVLAGNPQGSEHFRDLLAGQILWVGWERLPWAAATSAALLPAWLLLRARAGGAGFYLVFALAVTLSVQLVGVFLVFASLIAPALATRRLGGWRRLTLAYLLGTAGYAAGLAASLRLDLPAGAAIVWALGLLAVSGLAGIRHGGTRRA